MGYHCYDFGDKLLKGDMRRVRHIIRVYRNRPEHINLEILQEWLKGGGRRPVTWEILVETLKQIRLYELAWDIQGAKTTAGTADEPPPTPAPGMISMCCVGTCVLIGCFGYIHVPACTVCFDLFLFVFACLLSSSEDHYWHC